ncbi:MAG: hypothetical protein IPI85_02980 [Dehalococcoidia bacterium]|nr:hypothetical protein [Dehalococcoidia bacterium]
MTLGRERFDPFKREETKSALRPTVDLRVSHLVAVDAGLSNERFQDRELGHAAPRNVDLDD